MNKFIGTGVALITPFDKNKNVDYIALKKLVNFQIENGIDYLVILGTTGESATLNNKERQQVIQTIVETNNKKLPLVLGIGGNNTQQAIEDIKNTDLSDFDAILSVSPFYNKPTQEGIYQHFKTIANSTNKNIILYNVPHRTGKNVEPETIVRLAHDCENIIAVKDAASDLQQTLEIIRTKPKDFLVISGDDSLALSSVLAGGAGVISVIGQGMPNAFSKMINLGLAGKNQKAFKLHYKLMPLTELIFQEGNPAGIKAILNHKNICDTQVRLPLIKVSENLYNSIINEL
jgi:4-hydroxy-tetrahydrodipicolinate synthase